MKLCLPCPFQPKGSQVAMMMRVVVRLLAIGMLLVGYLFAVASPAAATMPSPGPWCGTGTLGQVCYAYIFHPANATTWTTECWGREGTFKGDADVMVVDWNGDNRWDECFGIAPNRAIYHAWPNSVGWDPMPNGGLADEVFSAFLYQSRYHTVSVWVSTVSRYYCSSLIGNGWQPWGQCSPLP
jgi:hypothetical protein